ncbi:MAG: hypothetical protein ACKVOU_03530 [Cytophagales bacterium]
MVNVIIYLEKSNEAKILVDNLLKFGLVANASIDMNNISYRIEDGNIVESTNSVITAQSKSLLFSSIEVFVKEEYGPNVPIYSLPITQANDSFDSLIRGHTIKT